MKTNESGASFGLLCGSAFLGALLVAEQLGLEIARFYPSVSIFGLGIVLCVPVVWWAARSRGLFEASTLALAIVPALAICASFVLDESLKADSHSPYFANGSTAIGAIASGTVIFFAPCIGFVGAAMARTRASAIVLFFVRVLAMASIGESIVLVSASFHKAQSAIAPNEFRAQLDHETCVEGLRSATQNPERLPEGRDLQTSTSTDGELLFTHHADFKHGLCRLRIEGRDASGEPVREIALANAYRRRHDEALICGRVCVGRIADRNIWRVRIPTRDGSRDLFRGNTLFALQSDSLLTFAGVLAPPLAWRVIALLGVLTAIGILITLRVRRDRILEPALDWDEVTLGGDLVLRSPEWKDGLYRGPSAPSDRAVLLPESADALKLRLERLKLGHWSLVLAVVAMTATPLAIAACAGIVF